MKSDRSRPASFCRLADELRSATHHRCPIQVRLGALPHEIAADERLLRPVLTNLITNAVKYSDAGKPVELFAGGARRPTGPGGHRPGMRHSTGVLPTLLEPFRRGRNVSHVPGAGLGLAIVRRCIQLHGGTIDLASEIGIGTTVTLRVPLRPLEASAINPS